MMLNEEMRGKEWSNTVLVDSRCTEWKVIAAYFKGLTDDVLSQGSVQHS